jgi:nitroreductase
MRPTQLLSELRAVRRFSEQPIPDDVLADILEVARWTGSSGNSQRWELLVVHERDMLRELATLAPNGDHLGLAQLAVVQIINGPNVGPAFDAGRQVERLMLAAWAHGIGSCIAGIFPPPNQQRAKALLGIPPDLSVSTAIPLGYPANRRSRFLSADPSVLRSPLITGRKPLTSMVSWGRYGQHR